jgi:hypothetical protein
MLLRDPAVPCLRICCRPCERQELSETNLVFFRKTFGARKTAGHQFIVPSPKASDAEEIHRRPRTSYGASPYMASRRPWAYASAGGKSNRPPIISICGPGFAVVGCLHGGVEFDGEVHRAAARVAWADPEDANEERKFSQTQSQRAALASQLHQFSPNGLTSTSNVHAEGGCCASHTAVAAMSSGFRKKLSGLAGMFRRVPGRSTTASITIKAT